MFVTVVLNKSCTKLWQSPELIFMRRVVENFPSRTDLLIKASISVLRIVVFSRWKLTCLELPSVPPKMVTMVAVVHDHDLVRIRIIGRATVFPITELGIHE